MRKRTNLVATCSKTGYLKIFVSKTEIEVQQRRKEFFKSGTTAELFIFSQGVKNAIKNFRNGKTSLLQKSR